MILRPVPPFRLDLTVWALRRRARNVIDRWDGRTYRRAVIVGRRPTELAVRQEGLPGTPRVIVTVTPCFETESEATRLRGTIERLLGLPPSDATELRERLTQLQALYQRHIMVEDQQLFPAAARVLHRGQLHQIGREMAARRQIRSDVSLD